MERPRFSDWFNQIHFSAGALAGLGFAAECWYAKPELYEGWQQLRDRLVALGRRPTRHQLAYDLASHLLEDVIVAAGGAERAVTRLRASLKDLRAYAAEHGIRAVNGIPHSLSADASIDAWYAFADLLSWSRMVVERIDRPPGDRRHFGRQGLLHAIKPKRLRRRCTDLFNELNEGPVGRSRPLTNFMLHSALVRHPITGVELGTNGEISLPIPDLPSIRVTQWYLLTWSSNQDGFAFGETLWSSIERFVDGLLSAFEIATPKRLRRVATSRGR